MRYSSAVQELIDQLGRLPGIGPKSAQRVAFYLLKSPAEDANRLARAISDAKEKVSYCPRCFNLAERGDECAVCRDPKRDPGLVCVVEDAQDVVAVERTGEFGGRYHVLQGAFSPIDGVGVDQLRVKELLARVTDEGITEVIVATNPNLEGEATAMLVHKYLKPAGVQRDPHRQRPTRGGRPRVRRRTHPGASLRGPPITRRRLRPGRGRAARIGACEPRSGSLACRLFLACRVRNVRCRSDSPLPC